MSYDQYIELPTQQHPSLSLQPPTPVSGSGSYSSSSFMPASPSPTVSTNPLPISSRPTSRAGTPSLSRSNSTRHHPYSASPASFSDRPTRSGTSANDRSDWSDAGSFDLYSSSVDSYAFTPSSSFNDLSLPNPATLSLGTDAPQPIPPSPARSKSGRANKSHARKTAPGHIKRPPNAFILFRSHCCSPDAPANPSLPEPPGTAHARLLKTLDISNSQHISVIVSKVWKGLLAEEKSYWDLKAKEAKEEHQRLHPEYRYKPQQRTKGDVRRRKRTDPADVLEHREACEEVARQVLQMERQEQGLEPIYVDDVHPDHLPIPPSILADALQKEFAEQKSAPAPKKRVRKKPAPKAKPTTAVSSPETTMFAIDLPEHQDLTTPRVASSSAFQQPSSTPFVSPQQLGDFSYAAPQPYDSFGGRMEQSQAASHGGQDGQFSYMNQLNDEHVAANMASLDPHLAGLALSRPGSSASFQQQLQQQPEQQELSTTYDFFAAAPQQQQQRQPEPQTAFSLPRPPSPRSAAIQQMQHYTLGVSPPAPPPPHSSSGSPFQFGTASPGFSNGRQRAMTAASAPPPLDALKQRRGTLRPSTVGTVGSADLVLISPMTKDFGGCKQSLGGAWNGGLRRVSLSQGWTSPDPSTPRPLFARSSLATGVLAENQTFETFSFPQEVLESLPTEDPYSAAEFFAQFTQTMAEEEEYDSRPSTASSAWSMDEEVERLEASLPPGYLDRRRSTIGPSNFGSVPFSAPATSAGFHIGNVDFFGRPEPPLATAGPTTSTFNHPSPPPPSQHPSVALDSPEFGGSFRPFNARPSVDAILAASSPSSFLPPGGVSTDSSQQRETGLVASASSMRNTALSILHDRLHRRQQQQQQQQQQLSAPHMAASTSLDAIVEKGAQPECEYVFLTVDQLQDNSLMERICSHGYGIAFRAAPVSPPSTSPHLVHSATF